MQHERMDFSDIPDFAIEKTQVEFTGFWDWLVAYNDICPLWRAQPSYIYVQLLFLVGSFVTLYHALKNGGRFLQLWVGVILHGTVVETIAYNLPDIDNFWHSQTPIIFFGRRLPLYIPLTYVVFLYTAVVTVDKLKLPRWSEPFAVGLVVVLIDYPYDMMGVRLMHWTWHDTDPNVSDKHYHIPWTSFYFHLSFATSFVFWFHFTRLVAFGKTEKWSHNKSIVKECTCTIITAFLGMPGGVLLFIPLYHPLHDIYKIHAEVAVFFLFTIYVSIIWLSIPRISDMKTSNANKLPDYMLLLYMVSYYIFYICLGAFIDPSSEISIGWHEKVGPCNEKIPLQTALGHTLYKRKYLCAIDNDETYFGWSCLPNGKPPKNGAMWYTICGTPFTNRAEYVVCLTAIGIFASSFFFKALYFYNKTDNNKLKDNTKKSVQKDRKMKSH